MEAKQIRNQITTRNNKNQQWPERLQYKFNKFRQTHEEIWGKRERTGEVGHMEVEARGVEGPIAGVSVGGLEVAAGVELGWVPEPASEVREKRELRPELGDLGDENGVVVDGSEGVVEGVLSSFYGPRSSVYAQLRLPLHRRSGAGAVPSGSVSGDGMRNL